MDGGKLAGLAALEKHGLDTALAFVLRSSWCTRTGAARVLGRHS